MQSGSGETQTITVDTGSTPTPPTTNHLGKAHDTDTITAAFPTGRRAAIEKCERSEVTTNQALRANCTIKTDTALAASFIKTDTALAASFPEYSNTFYANVDPKAAKTGFREHDYKGYKLTENTTSTAGVNIKHDTDYVSGNYVNVDNRPRIQRTRLRR